MSIVGRAFPRTLQIGSLFLFAWLVVLVLMIVRGFPYENIPDFIISEFWASIIALLIALIFPFIRFQWVKEHKITMLVYLGVSLVVVGMTILLTFWIMP